MITGRGGPTMRGGRIRPPRRNPVAAGQPNDFEQIWERLRDALRDIHNKNAGNLSFEQLYRYSYKIVVKKAGAPLYERVQKFEQDWFAQQVLPPISELITKSLVSITLGEVPGISAAERRGIGERFLKGVKNSWEDHNLSMNMIADILMYLDRAYAQDHNAASIYTTTIGLFRDHILRSDLSQIGYHCEVFAILNATILDQINMEREGDIINRGLVRGCVAMLEDLYETSEEIEDERLYLTTFEPAYLKAAHSFYQKECKKLLQDGDASAWLRYTERRLEEEGNRCQTTVSRLTEPKIAQVVDQELIEKHLADFLGLEGSGVKTMIDNDRIEDLRILYQLISRVDPKKIALRNALASRVVDLGSEIQQALKNTDFSVAPSQPGAEEGADADTKSKSKPLNAQAQQTAAAIKWVNDILVLKDKFDNLLTSCFEKDMDVQTTLNKGFSEFINSFNRSPEYVSLYIDDNLKRGIKGKSEEEIDTSLVKAVTLIRFLGDKDRFENYYQKHLARRLLHNKSESEEVEREMISRMKQELGQSFVSKFHGMFKDIETSREETDGYRKHIRSLGTADDHQIDLTINILAGNNWPREIMGRQSGLADAEGKQAKATYPREIDRLQASFLKFYLKNRSGRILNWVASAGTADIRCTFPKISGKTSGPLSKERRYDVNVGTYGMIVLLLFNDIGDDEWLSFEEIQARTNIPNQDLINTLTSLSVIKTYKILTKEGAQSKSAAKPGDRFTFNREFVSKTLKVKVPSVNAANKVENDDERKDTDKKNLDTRKYRIDAAVVRIMKQRKELKHAQLITEVIQVLSSQFQPDVALIKGQIESLISREYLERMESDVPAYRYVA